MDKVDELLKRLDIKYPPCGFYIGDGWFPIVAQALEAMVLAGWDRDLQQVKQKFCGLRIYIGERHEPSELIIRYAVQRCSVACEDCGKPHGLDNPMWGRALCEACR